MEWPTVYKHVNFCTMLQEFAVIKKGLQDQELIKSLIKKY